MNSLYKKLEVNDNLKKISGDLLNEGFESFYDDISCKICMMVPYSCAVSCSNCSVVYCKPCIEEWLIKNPKCPNDHSYTEAPLNPLSKRLLNQIKLRCINFDKGCVKDILYGDYYDHMKNYCEYSQYKCMGCCFVGIKNMVMMHANVCENFEQNCAFCKKLMKIKDLSDHVKKCNERTEQCDLCEMTIKASFLSEHNEICDYKEIQCNYCKLKMKRKDEVRHTKDICLKEVMSIVSKLSDNYNDLKDNSELIKKQLQKSESDKKNLEYQLANEISSKNKILNDFKLANSNKDELIKTNSQLSNSLEELKSNNNKLVSNIKEYKLSYDKLKKYSEDLERKLRNNSPNRSPLGTNQNCKINPFDLFFTIKK